MPLISNGLVIFLILPFILLLLKKTRIAGMVILMALALDVI
ncbi:MAG: hypothetical protein PUG17_02550 [Stecheria intestinalis]|nr:hypothetical protein [Stecheria intestinalis]